MSGLPAGLAVEIEFSTGSWTNVTQYVDTRSPITIRKGRSTLYDSPQAGTLTLSLENDDSRFTPNMQVLKDLTTTHPYYPNVVARKRIRVRYTAGTRFVGYIEGWPASVTADGRSIVSISATDDFRRACGVQLGTHAIEELRLLNPLYAWPLNDPSGALWAKSLAPDQSVAVVRWAKSNPVYAFGDSSNPGPDGSTTLSLNTGLTLANRNAKKGTRLNVQAAFGTALSFPFTIVANIKSGDVLNETGTVPIIYFANPDGSAVPENGGIFQQGQQLNVSGVNNITVGVWHHIAVTFKNTGQADLYTDGVLTAANIGGLTPSWMPDFTQLNIGGDGTTHWVGSIANVGILAGAITAPQALALYQAAATGFANQETTDARISRLLSYANMASGASLEAGQETVGLHNPNGMTVLGAIEDIVNSAEGPPAVFYIAGDGTPTFRNRAHRANPSLVLTIDADQDGGPQQDFENAMDLMANDVTATRNAGTTVRAVNVASVTTWGRIQPGTQTLFGSTDDGALDWVQAQVLERATPRLRFKQILLDLLTATTGGLAATVAGLKVGDLVRVVTLPATFPHSQEDTHVEGWTETIAPDTWAFTFDTSPRSIASGITFDAGESAVLSTDDTSLKLNAAITAAATSMSVASVAGEALSTTAGDYPLTLFIDEEQVTITAAPASGVSPQTCTITRGVNGTRAAAHVINAPVVFSPFAVLGY